MRYDSESVIKTTAILLTVMAGLLLIYRLNESQIATMFSQNPQSISLEPYQEPKQEPPSFAANSADVVALEFNQLLDIDDYSREQIFSLRKSYVENSIFAFDGYDSVNSPVLNQIISKKPWVGIDGEGEYDTWERITAGLSEETRFLNNPNILAGIALGVVRHCLEPTSGIAQATIPEKITYFKKDNTVEVVYNLSMLYDKVLTCQGVYIENQNFRLVGLNARDLGYPYAYVSEASNIIFTQQNNISNEITEFLDFIRVGSSCRVDGGCNNGSPRQDNLVFQLRSLPKDVETHMVIKFWKKRPYGITKREDTKLIMIFK